MVDLKEAGVDILTLGQYLQPTPLHLSVKEFVTPQKFEQWRVYAEDVIGFRYAVAPGSVLLRSRFAFTARRVGLNFNPGCGSQLCGGIDSSRGLLDELVCMTFAYPDICCVFPGIAQQDHWCGLPTEPGNFSRRP